MRVCDECICMYTYDVTCAVACARKYTHQTHKHAHMLHATDTHTHTHRRTRATISLCAHTMHNINMLVIIYRKVSREGLVCCVCVCVWTLLTTLSFQHSYHMHTQNTHAHLVVCCEIGLHVCVCGRASPLVFVLKRLAEAYRTIPPAPNQTVFNGCGRRGN